MIAHRQCCYVRAEAVGFSDKRIAADLELMHLVPTRRATIRVAWSVIGIVTALNVILIVLTVAGV
jgi:hypothetical protein